MKKNKYTNKAPQRIALTIFFATMIFIIFSITMLIVSSIIFALVRFGIWKSYLTMGFPILIIVITIASIVVGTIVATLLSKIPLKPFNKLIYGMKKLAQGQYETKIDLGNYSIFKELEDSFNTLSEELKNTELLRSDFINNFSHEFKTPIVSIRGFARLLQKGDLTPEQQQEYLDVIVEESTRLSTMATNVLNLTKIENQAILTDIINFNLSEQIRNCILLLEKKWTEKKLSIEADFNEYNINANYELLKQVWINILDNAIKFSYQYGEIKVFIEEINHDLVVTIKNNGEEIPKEDQKRIFNKFYQADTSHSSEGTGVGLAICKRIIELHHGLIGLTSNQSETAFIVKLPKEN